MKLDSGVKRHLIQLAFNNYLEDNGLETIGADQFIYLAKQLSFRNSPTYTRTLKELERFFSGSQFDAIENVVKTALVSMPGVYATQIFEKDNEFPDFFVYKRKNPKDNFFVKAGETTKTTEKLSKTFKVKFLKVDIPDELSLTLKVE